jgi:hypothetical protein
MMLKSLQRGAGSFERAEAARVVELGAAFEQLQQLLVCAASLSLRNRGAQASRTLRLGELPAASRSG